MGCCHISRRDDIIHSIRNEYVNVECVQLRPHALIKEKQLTYGSGHETAAVLLLVLLSVDSKTR